jgi:DedD protein
MASEDTEITLGTGRLLGLFFLLAAICGVFFSIGYSLGKSTAREQALNDQPGQVLAASPASAATSSQSTEDKPSAVLAAKPDAEPPAQKQAGDPAPPSNLTFYKAVQGNGDAAPAPAKENPPAVAPKAPTESGVAASVKPVSSIPLAEAAIHGGANPPVSRSGPMTGPGTIVVQIAALSREDDAVSLAGALRKKDYNVFVVNNPATHDKFYHVQVGPFATMQDAEAMKTRLVAEGYNPIVKK